QSDCRYPASQGCDKTVGCSAAYGHAADVNRKAGTCRSIKDSVPARGSRLCTADASSVRARLIGKRTADSATVMLANEICCVKPCCWTGLRTSTVAFGITAPEGSTTMPVIDVELPD